ARRPRYCGPRRSPGQAYAPRAGARSPRAPRWRWRRAGAHGCARPRPARAGRRSRRRRRPKRPAWAFRMSLAFHARVIADPVGLPLLAVERESLLPAGMVVIDARPQELHLHRTPVVGLVAE